MKKTIIQLAMVAVLFSCTKTDQVPEENALKLQPIGNEKLVIQDGKTREVDGTLLKQLPVNTHINEEIEKHLSEILEPVRNLLQKAIESDGTGNFKRYEEAVAYAKSLKDPGQQIRAVERLKKEYYPFIKDLWEKAAIDERNYQQAILNVFPENLRKGVVFQEFLNFTIGPSEKPEPPIPPAPPAPENICIDVHDFMQGAFWRDGLLVGGVRNSIRPTDGNCAAFATVTTTAISAGAYTGCSWLLNRIALPGTFPIDARPIRYKKAINWTANATAVAVLGGAWSTIAYTINANTDKFTDPGGEIYTAVAPVIFVCVLPKSASVSDEQLHSKVQLNTLNFGGVAYAQSKSILILSPAFSTATSTISIAPGKWTACEEEGK
ncbi:hypothetical protein U0035_18960 [Niabella yanshanensis]|uniref:Uncharacterized protein n=1 Tax=Niabella yanshanensis TaxID=577386 RepID=A0ABZ0W6P8_9BACT|nr:hypothetical protein [Niabella yanshanensis]WQD37751.1 hypothetical protein U0035_18960 [Niabella yanshanensis]